MFYSSILSDFHKELNTIEKKDDDILTQCNSAKLVCIRTLESMREIVEKKGFQSSKNEIDFFKNIKTIPMSYLVNYSKISKLEFREPRLGFDSRKKYLQFQIDRVNRSFKKERALLQYMETGSTHFDYHYFTRDNIYQVALDSPGFPYYKDSMFNTSHDFKWAELKGLKMFAKYIEKKYRSFKNSKSENKVSNSMKWTGSSAAFVEFVYGCHALGYFNGGNITVAKVFQELGEFLKVPSNNSSRTYNEIKNRKSSRIKFFKEAGEKLLEKMDKEDGFDG